MDISKLKTADLRSVVSLLGKRESLEKELSQINSKIETILGGGSVSSRKSGGKRGATRSRKGKGGKRRGALKEGILAALKAAGPAGVGAKELSSSLNVPNQNIHVWFSSTGKKVPGIRKTEDKRWVLEE